MSRLSQINTYAESTIQQLYGNTSVEDIRTHFTLVQRRVDEMLDQLNKAERLEHLSNSGLITPDMLSIIKQAVSSILHNSNDLPTDLNKINNSGIHSIESYSHLSYVISEILERADTLQRGVGFGAWLKAVIFRKKYFTDRFNAVVAGVKNTPVKKLQIQPEEDLIDQHQKTA